MSEMGDISAESGAELRAARRTNLMLAAEIEQDGHRAPVRIRNLSETGALIEGSALPEKGSALVLHRSSFHIGATVAWSGGGRCGIHFDRPISVPQWTGKAIPSPAGGSGFRDQRRVDAFQAEARAAPTVPSPAPPAATRAAGEESRLDMRDRLADELAFVRRLLDSLGDELVGEPIVVAHHSRALQNIDLASQILAHLSKVLASDDPVAAVERIGMEDLRARLKRKPLV
jgi:hypothetical protein